MTGWNPIDSMNYIEEQGDKGRQRGIAGLLGQAYAQPEQRAGLLGKVAMAGAPDVAMQAEQSFGKQADDRMERFVKQLPMVVGAYKGGNPQLAQSLWSGLHAQSPFDMPLPPQIDDEGVMALEQIIQMTKGEAEQFTLTPGAARYDASGKVIASQPLAPANASIIKVPDGQGGMIDMIFDPKTRQLSEPQYPGAAPQGPSGSAPAILEGAYRAEADPVAIQSLFKQLAPQFGAQITSLQRSPKHNEKVGGVANSQHLTGTAGDFVVPESQKAAFRQTMQAKGFEVIDEGDHMHVELPPQRRGGSSRLGYTPPKMGGVPSGYRPAPGGGLEPIPGGPAEIAIQARAEAAAARKAADELKASQTAQVASVRQVEAATAANQLVSAIDTLTKSEGFDALGTAWGDIQLNTPLLRSGAKDAQAQLKNVAGQVALATMAKLKALSSSGATGFGSLTAPELKLLENSIASLQSENISNAELKRSLKVIRDTMEKTAQWSPSQQPAKAPAHSGKFSGFKVLD